MLRQPPEPLRPADGSPGRVSTIKTSKLSKCFPASDSGEESARRLFLDCGDSSPLSRGGLSPLNSDEPADTRSPSRVDRSGC